MRSLARHCARVPWRLLPQRDKSRALRIDDGNNVTYIHFFIIFIFDRLSHIIMINCLIYFNGATRDDVIDGSLIDDDWGLFRVVLQGVQ